jgi:hypothetical protein
MVSDLSIKLLPFDRWHILAALQEITDEGFSSMRRLVQSAQINKIKAKAKPSDERSQGDQSSVLVT